mmetsp:Transcript_30316/g.64207  ORF Transcript_30316/g.64207 Transcript_30316/m.64207 type:complete len:267 (+) Transcript_30316:1-801(+)
MPRPKRSCAMCFWGAESKCSKCKTVYYCSRTCQTVHHKEHKHGCIAAASAVDANSDQSQSYPKPDYPEEEWIEDEYWEGFQHNAGQLGLNMIQCAANNCHLGALKRALMENDGMRNVNKLVQGEGRYPIHLAALRNEPDAAMDIIRLLLKHGACPNVIRFDGEHLLQVCRGRAQWIDDTEPSMGNVSFRSRCQTEGPEQLEELERKESSDLVELVTEAIQMHSKCKFCKKQKACRVNYFADGAKNMTDEMLKVLDHEAADGVVHNA